MKKNFFNKTVFSLLLFSSSILNNLQVYAEEQIAPSIPGNNSQTFILGDVNADGDFSVSDVILLQKYLLGNSNISLINWEAADFYKDNILNIFDLCLMKKNLISVTNKLKFKNNYVSTEVKNEILNSIIKINNNINFDDFTFEYVGVSSIPKNIHDYINTIGKTYSFNIYYKNTLLNPNKYKLIVNKYDNGSFETDCSFFQQDIIKLLSNLNLMPTIDIETAIKKAESYSNGLEINYFSKNLGKYKISNQFGSYSEKIIYSVEDCILAYKIYDNNSIFDGIDVWDVDLKVYVNTYNGEIIDQETLIDLPMT